MGLTKQDVWEMKQDQTPTPRSIESFVDPISRSVVWKIAGRSEQFASYAKAWSALKRFQEEERDAFESAMPEEWGTWS